MEDTTDQGTSQDPRDDDMQSITSEASSKRQLEEESETSQRKRRTTKSDGDHIGRHILPGIQEDGRYTMNVLSTFVKSGVIISPAEKKKKTVSTQVVNTVSGMKFIISSSVDSDLYLRGQCLTVCQTMRKTGVSGTLTHQLGKPKPSVGTLTINSFQRLELLVKLPELQTLPYDILVMQIISFFLFLLGLIVMVTGVRITL
jgi:hypothetical protein